MQRDAGSPAISAALLLLGLLWLGDLVLAAVHVAIPYFAFMLVDDSFSLHERFGLYAASAWPMPAWFGLRPQDVGEGLFALTVGSFAQQASWAEARMLRRVKC